MYYLSLFIIAYFGLISAHGHEALPKFLGGGHIISELRALQYLDHTQTVAGAKEPKSLGPSRIRRDVKEPRVGARDGQCGPGYGSCAAGLCCSSHGWCGASEDYCTAPDCQMNYGSGCDSNQKPEGADTLGIPRPHVGDVLYAGAGIYRCKNKGDIAITFDDGPYKYTDDLLDKLEAYGAKATFFITGNNLGKGMINDASKPWGRDIKRMIAGGHQVASHTWSHQNSSQLTRDQFMNQIVWNEIALNDILGFIPTYMRPPYSICGQDCRDILDGLGYHIVYFDLDTEGYLHDDAARIQGSKDIWDGAVDRPDPSRSAFLVIEHDIVTQTVYNLTDYMLVSLVAKGYRAVTVGECLGDPPENWYRPGVGGGGCSPHPPEPTTTAPEDEDVGGIPSTTIGRPGASPTASKTTGPPPPCGSSASPSPVEVEPEATATFRISRSGTCGGDVTCLGSRFGNCCSLNGWCGGTLDYCSQGCQAGFGECGWDATITPPAPQATAGVSIDGICGDGITCLGSRYGDCCSSYGWCGRLPAHCGTGCNPSWGECLAEVD